VIDVYLNKINAQNGYWLYQVFADGEKITAFVARPGLKVGEELDVCDYFREGLDGYRSAMIP
jgi:hypothetical protein